MNESEKLKIRLIASGVLKLRNKVNYRISDGRDAETIEHVNQTLNTMADAMVAIHKALILVVDESPKEPPLNGPAVDGGKMSSELKNEIEELADVLIGLVRGLTVGPVASLVEENRLLKLQAESLESGVRAAVRRLRSLATECFPQTTNVVDSAGPLVVGIPAETLVAWYNILQSCCRASFPTTKPLSQESIVLLYVECLERVQEFAENVLAQQIPHDLLEANDRPF